MDQSGLNKDAAYQQQGYQQQLYQQQPTTQSQPSYSQQPAQSSEWQHGLFGCFEGGSDNLCLKGTFCPCFVYGKTSNRLRNPTLENYSRFNSDCFTWGGLSYCGCQWIVQMMKQGEVRQQYGIEGNGCSDCLVSYCCHCCSLIRMEKEVISRQEQAGLLQAGYIAPPAGMVAEPKTQ